MKPNFISPAEYKIQII